MHRSVASGLRTAAVAVAFAVAALWIYAPALDGEFLSDDRHYVATNPYLHDLTAENVLAILDPTGPVVPLVENYAPVHLLAHALEWQVFGERVRGYHVVNVLLHALAAALLVPLYRRSGLPLAAALAGAAVFLVHPANVEAVAWISQLKSPAALVLAAGALLAQPRRPALGIALFALALLAKPMAAFALPVAALWAWIDRSGDASASAGADASWRWLAGWAGVLLVFGVVEVAAFAQTAGTAPLVYDDPGVRLRSSLANAARYLAMTVGAYPLSTWHEPPPADSWLDPWWLGSLAALGLVGWRIVHLLRSRPWRPELVWWAWAAGGYAPFCGLIPLPFAMADRYLYFVLPGLVGALLLAGRDAAAAARTRWPALETRVRASGDVVPAALVALAVATTGLLATRAHARAGIWVTNARMQADAILHYPNGRAALLGRASRAAQMGDMQTMVAALREAHGRGYDRIDVLVHSYGRFRGDPAVQAFFDDVAADWIARLEARPTLNALDLHLLAYAHELRGETAEAVSALERALELGGPEQEQIERDLKALRARQRTRPRTP